MRGRVWGRRIGAVLLVLGAAGPPTSASAATVGTATFVATMTTSGPLDSPCVTTSKLCPATFPALIGAQPGPKGEPDLEVHAGGNLVLLTVTTDACFIDAANSDEGGKSPVDAGTCSLHLDGFLRGFCGLSESQTVGTLTGPTGGAGSAQSMPVTVELTDVGGVVVLTGLVGKDGDLGNLHGVGTLAAVPDPGVPAGNDCLAKTATRFTLAATVALKVLD